MTQEVPFRDALRVWLRVAAQSFGGPAGQIAVMHRILVEEKKWVSEERFLHALNYCMLLPGPEAQQLATYIGWLLHRVRGGLLAGGLFILPGFVSILILSILYARFQETLVVQALFYGLKAAILAIVLDAVVRIGKRVLKNGLLRLVAVLAFLGIFFLNIPFPWIVLSAGIIGYVGGKFAPSDAALPAGTPSVSKTRPSTAQTVRTTLTWLGIWLLPLAVLTLWLGSNHVLVREGWFFSQTAVVTFGGAYAVLAYIAQEAVATFNWLEPGEMLDGLGMAETTPGPLIQVVQFVGFMGAYRYPAGLDPLWAGVFGSIVTTWATFAPCFLWIFAGAPYIEYLRGKKSLTAALSGITAAVVGVVLNLAVWFGFHTLFTQVDERQWHGLRLLVPQLASFDLALTGIAALASFLVFRTKLGMLGTMGISTALGMLAFYLLPG